MRPTPKMSAGGGLRARMPKWPLYERGGGQSTSSVLRDEGGWKTFTYPPSSTFTPSVPWVPRLSESSELAHALMEFAHLEELN